MTSKVPTITTLLPTIENTDPIVLHRRSTPTTFSLPERSILYGGGRKWFLRCSDPSTLRLLPLDHSQDIQCDVYVLNTGLVIWFTACSKGIEIPYSSVGLHAVRQRSSAEGGMLLYLQVSALGALEGDGYAVDVGFDAVVEFELMPMYKEDERYYNDVIERLFSYEFFGVNKGDKMVMNTFNAVSECSALYVSESDEMESDYEDEDEMDAEESVDMKDVAYDNSGVADDINMNTSLEDDTEQSGTDVVFYDQFGRRRNRDELESSPREVKRLRC